MPIVRVTVEPSSEPVAVEAWVCVVCGTKTIHTGLELDPAAIEQYFTGLGWRILRDEEPVCSRCVLHPDIAAVLLAHEHARGGL